MRLSPHPTVVFLLLVMIVHVYAADPVAQNDTLPLYWTSEIVVVAERLPMHLNTSINQLKGDQITSRDVQNPAQALQFIPGLHVYHNSKNEVVLNIRGFEQRQVSVFLDGVPISLAYDGLIDLSQLSGDQAEIIRVARGSISPLYGVNSLGGGINLISGMLEKKSGTRLRLEGSTHSRFYASAGYFNHIGHLKFRFFGNYSKGDGFSLPEKFNSTNSEDGSHRENSSFEKISLGMKIGFDLSERHQFAFDGKWIQNKFDIPPNTKTTTVRYWRFPEWQKRVYSLHGRHVFSGRFFMRTVLFYDSFYNLLKSYDDASYRTQLQRYAWDSVYDDYSFGFFIYPTLSLTDLGSSNLIISYKKDVHRESFRNTEFDIYKISTFTVGLEQDLQIAGGHSIVLGADISQLEPHESAGGILRGSSWMLNGQFAYQYDITSNTKIHFSIAQKGRYPTLKEFYSERLGSTIPNSDLKTERAINTELGVLQKTGLGHFKVIFYHNLLRNLISARELGDGNQQLQNIGQAVLQGIELDSKINLGRNHILIAYTLLSARDISQKRRSARLANRPLHRLNLLVELNIIKDLTATLENILVLDQYYENPNTLSWEKFDNYYLLNLRLSYTLHQYVEAYFRMNNAGNMLYENDFGMPMPGREIISGIRFML